MRDHHDRDGAPQPREVTRLLNPSEHLEGYHAANFAGDLADMLAAPGDVITEPTRRFLTHLERTALQLSKDTLEGVAVVLSPNHWASFKRLRLQVIRSRLEPMIKAGFLPPHRSARPFLRDGHR